MSRRDDLDEEVRAHLEMATRDRIERGETPAEAARAARKEFGNVALVKEVTSAMWRWHTVEHLAQDVRHSLRLLRRRPGVALASMICIACGVGVTTTIFGAVNALLLRPLPYADAHELAIIRSRNISQNIPRGPVAWPDMQAWRNERRVFADIGVWSPMEAELAGAGADPERVLGAQISPGVLQVLRQFPIVGRNFEEADQQFGNHRKVLLSHGLWKRRYGGDPEIVGRTIEVGHRPVPVQPHLVVGVLPPGVSFPEGAELWIPADIDVDEYAKHGSRHYSAAIARLTPGATLTDANATVATIAQRLRVEYPQAQAGWDAHVISLRDHLVGDLRPTILLFQGAAALVLLIACANVANLMLARGATRQREMAIRMAIGAGSARIVRHLLTESLVLAILGGAAGVLLAFWGVRLLTIAFPDGVPSYVDLSVDRIVLAFTTAVSIATGVLFGLAPALQACHVTPGSTLQQRERAAGWTPGRARARGALVAFEVAISVVLVIGATLLVRSDRSIRSRLGFDPRGVLSIGVPTPPDKYEGPPREVFYSALADRVRTLPGVQAVGWAGASAPLERTSPAERQPIRVEGRVVRPDDASEALVYEISPDYLRATGVTLVRGRAIAPADRPAAGDASSFVAIVNDAFVRTYFPNEDPIGKRLQAPVPGAGNMGTPTFTVVGVAGDFRQERPPQAVGPAMYVYMPLGNNSQVLTIRTTLADPLTLVPSIQTILRQMDPTLPPPHVRSFEAAIARGLWRERLHEQVLSIFAALAVVLAVFGVYGVIAFAVAQRTHEFGVRLALGATRAQVLGLVLRQGAWSTVIGVMAGVAAALQLTSMLSSVLHDVRPTDPVTFIGVSLGLTAVVLLATVSPARSASKVDPVVALRVDG